VTDPAAEPPLSDNAVKCPHKKDSADQSESSASKSADTKKKDEEGKDKCGESEPAATPIGGPGP
jgi:hypothetical protein